MVFSASFSASPRLRVKYTACSRAALIHLRRKIGDDPAEPRYLRNVRGLGYRFDG
jgi:DNA-binding response OmpR family regulator